MAANASPDGADMLRQMREDDTVNYDLNERTRHELIRGTFTNIGTLIKIGFWVGVGLGLGGMIFWLIAMLLAWAFFGSVMEAYS